MIQAEAHSDDQAISISFDAEPYFEQASDEDLKELVDYGFRGDYPADYVLLHFEEQEGHDASRLMAYVRASGLGFECRVDQPEALAWIRRRRPLLALLLD